MALTFADTHNMVAYLTKSDVSEGFYQIIDFLNASSIKYALTVNPNIYVSCIKQFWTYCSAKKVNDVTRLQALVDKKKVIITEATIRDALRLDDAESIDCLPNEEIFTELSRIGTQVGDLSSHFTNYSSPALTQKVFANMRRVGKGFSDVDTPLFEGMIVAQQADEGVAEVNVDDVPAAGVVNECAVSVAIDDLPAAVDEPSIPLPTPPTQPPPPSQDLPSTSQKLERMNKLKVSKLRRLKKVETLQRVDTSKDTVMDDVFKQGRITANMDADKDITLKDVADIDKKVVVDAEIEENTNVQGRQAESQAQIYQINLEHADKVLSMQDDKLEPTELQEVVEVVTTAKLMTKVVTAASATIIAADIPITDVAPTLTTALSAARRRKEVVIRDSKEIATPSTIIHTKPKSKDKGTRIMVHEPKPLKKKTQIEHDEAYARELEAKLNNNIDWDEVIEKFQRKEKEDNAKFNSNMAHLVKTKDQMEEEDSRALKRKVESSEDKAAKKQKLDKEVEELRKHLQIVPNDDDDVYTEATPLALKVPIVDYKIYTENNKPYYKIKRADGIHQLYLSFLSMLRNFDREDLEESKKCSWFSKGQKLETVRVMWCADYNIHYNTVDPAGREKISVNKVHSGSNAQQSLELMLLRTSNIYTKGLRLLVKELLLSSQVDAVG
nr:hypothetical protein [Tanacetum cinerariifolium]